MSIIQFLTDFLEPQSTSDNDLQKKMRLHQSWWRAFVLAEEQGYHPINKRDKIGNCILNGEQTGANFIDGFALKAAKEVLSSRDQKSRGMIQADRLYNNLLSSQPLCFNFFGRLKYNRPLATKVISQFFPGVKEITHIHFEYAPNASKNGDNSAHDIALEFISNEGKRGLIGLECKYTEPFSPKEYGKENNKYKSIYDDSSAFTADYDELTNTRYNQLFRNQLIIESALENNLFEVGCSGLFCFQDDRNALTTGKEFQKMLKNGEERFKIITFADLIETIQKMEIDWETREWSMMLWARYCGTKLSGKFTK